MNEQRRRARRERTVGRRQRLSPKARRRWLIGTLVTLVSATALLTGGAWVAAQWVQSSVPDPVDLADQGPAVTGPAVDPNGTWVAGPGTLAGYRLTEDLSGVEREVVARTDVVTVSGTVADDVLTDATIAVDVASMTSDEAARDEYVRRVLDVTNYPSATFVLNEPVDLAALEGGVAEATADGELTLGGVTKTVTAELRVQRSAAGLEIAATIPVTLSGFEISPPDLGFTKVGDDASIEALLLLTQG